ncbi:MAG TPA: hypothetical protein V6C97_26440 [Oculatellaceae cyanobacterium]
MIKRRQAAFLSAAFLYASAVFGAVVYPEPAKASVIDMAPQMINGVEVFVAQMAETTTAGGAVTAAGNICLSSAQTLALAEEGITIAARTPAGWQVAAAFGLGFGLGNLGLWAWEQGHPSERGNEGFVTDPTYPGEIVVTGNWDIAKGGWVCKGGLRASMEWEPDWVSYEGRSWHEYWAYSGDHTLGFGGWSYTWPNPYNASRPFILEQLGGNDPGAPPSTTILVGPGDRAGFNGALAHLDGSGYQALPGFMFGPWAYNPDYPTHGEPHDSLTMFQPGSDVAAKAKKLITDKIAANPPVTSPTKPTKGLVIAQKPGTDGSHSSDWDIKPAAESSFDPASDPGTPDGQPTPGPSISPSGDPSGNPSGDPSVSPSPSSSPDSFTMPSLPSFEAPAFPQYFIDGIKNKFPFDLISGQINLAVDAPWQYQAFGFVASLDFLKPFLRSVIWIGFVGLVITGVLAI